MLEFMQWIQDQSFTTYVRESALFYPAVLALHLIGIGLFGGMVAMTDLRVLGLAMKQEPLADVHSQLRPYKHLGLTLIVVCGLILGTSKAAIYWPNPWFKTKMLLLLLVAAHALIFRASVYKGFKEMDQTGVTSQAKLAAVLSLVFWIGLVVCGRMIGYWEPPSPY